MKCAGLKERCEWPEVGNAGSRSGGDKAKGKAKEKEVATSPRGGEKRKKKKTVAKVVEMPGPSGKRSGFDPGPFLERLDRLTGAMEEMTGQMRWASLVRICDRLVEGIQSHQWTSESPVDQ